MFFHPSDACTVLDVAAAFSCLNARVLSVPNASTSPGSHGVQEVNEKYQGQRIVRSDLVVSTNRSIDCLPVVTLLGSGSMTITDGSCGNHKLYLWMVSTCIHRSIDP